MTSHEFVFLSQSHQVSFLHSHVQGCLERLCRRTPKTFLVFLLLPAQPRGLEMQVQNSHCLYAGQTFLLTTV